MAGWKQWLKGSRLAALCCVLAFMTGCGGGDFSEVAKSLQEDSRTDGEQFQRHRGQ